LPKEVLRDLTFHPISEIEEMLPLAFPLKRTNKKKRKP